MTAVLVTTACAPAMWAAAWPMGAATPTPLRRRVKAVSAGVRRFGSAALDLAYVAAGRYDGFWETGLNPWDVAAGIVLVREAGGFVSEIDGGPNMLTSGSLLAANNELHGPLGDILRRVEGITQTLRP